MHVSSSRELRCTEDWIFLLSLIAWGLYAHFTRTVNCTLWCCDFFTPAIMIHCMQTSLLMKISWYNLLLCTSFGGPSMHLVGIQWCLHSTHWELWPVWLSAVHGWAGVAGHLAGSLSRISLLRFLLSSSSSFDRAWTFRSYFRISKHRSKRTS